MTPRVPEAAFPWDHTDVFADRVTRMRPSEIREFLKLFSLPGVVSFAGGIPDPALFPVDRLREAMEAIMGSPERRTQALQYAASEGYQPLREWIAGYMAGLGAKCTTANIIITTGSQQALDLLGKLFLDPGDTVLTTAPTYPGALQALDMYEPSFGTIDPTTGNVGGDIIDPKLAYLVPDFANPSGETLPIADRLRVLDMVSSMGIPLIEDAAYQVLRFTGEPVPSLLAMDIARTGHIDGSRVVYVGTFSKTIAPGLRVGWICASQDVIRRLVLARQAADLHGSILDQMLIHKVASSVFHQQVDNVVHAYRHRRDVMLRALERHMPSGVTWTKPDGGMFIWLTLPEGMDSRTLLVESLASEKIIFVPGTSFFTDGSGEHHIRLNYTLNDDATIVDGIRRLGRLVETALSDKPPTSRPAPVLSTAAEARQ